MASGVARAQRSSQLGTVSEVQRPASTSCCTCSGRNRNAPRIASASAPNCGWSSKLLSMAGSVQNQRHPTRYSSSLRLRDGGLISVCPQPRIKIIALEAINQERHAPAHDEQRDDAIAERAEIIVQAADRIPERALKLKLAADEAERFDAANHQGHQHGYRGDGQIVEQFAQRIAIGPAIGAEHQN